MRNPKLAHILVEHPSSLDQTYVVRVDDGHLPDVVSFNNIHVL